MNDYVPINIPGGGSAMVSAFGVNVLNALPVPNQYIQRFILSLRTGLLTAVDAPGDAANGMDVDVTRLPAITGTVTVSNLPSSQAVTGPLTDTQLRATAVPVSLASVPTHAVTGTFWQATQPVSGPLTDTQLRAAAVPVSGTFWQATQPVSGPLTDAQLRASAVPVSGPLSDAQLRAAAVGVQDKTANTLAVTGTAAAAAALTVTLPAVVGQFHYIEAIEVTAYSTAARTGAATPVVVTTTNLPGNPAFTFASAAAIGTTDRYTIQPTHPLRSAAANTATTIVCPATAGILWRVNVVYWPAT